MSCSSTSEQKTKEKIQNKVKIHYQDRRRLKIQFLLEVKSQVHDVHLNERFQSIKESDRFHLVLGEYNVFIQPPVTSAAQELLPISEKC